MQEVVKWVCAFEQGELELLLLGLLLGQFFLLRCHKNVINGSFLSSILAERTVASSVEGWRALSRSLTIGVWTSNWVKWTLATWVKLLHILVSRRHLCVLASLGHSILALEPLLHRCTPVGCLKLREFEKPLPIVLKRHTLSNHSHFLVVSLISCSLISSSLNSLNVLVFNWIYAFLAMLELANIE